MFLTDEFNLYMVSCLQVNLREANERNAHEEKYEMKKLTHQRALVIRDLRKLQIDKAVVKRTDVALGIGIYNLILFYTWLMPYYIFFRRSPIDEPLQSKQGVGK